jgi:SagB-type dehydrogenase family enzyme
MSKEINIGDRYHSETKYHRDRSLGGGLRWEKIPETYKTYPGAETISLPEPTRSAGESIWDVFSRRRSIRDYTSAAVSMEELSQLLWAIQGVTAHAGDYALRTAPSAGALYPIETYVLVNRVSDLGAGLYHYDVRQHRLEVVRKGDFGSDIAQAALGQTFLQEAALVFLWTAVVARSKWKYRERAYRYIYMDAGHIGQNAYLAAEVLGLGACTVGAFLDDEVNSVIGIDGENEIAIYLCAVGKKRM